MSESKCEIVQDLLALYAEGEVSAATAGFVEEHLSSCNECRRSLEEFQKPIFHAPGQLNSEINETREKTAAVFLVRLRRTFLMVLVLLALSAAGLASASYYAGKNVATRDPAYARAEKMGLITPVGQTKQLGQSWITVDGILFDAARTTVFYRMSPAQDMSGEIEIEMRDENGNYYPYFAGKGYRGEHFMAELAAIEPDARAVSLIFTDSAGSEKAVFDIQVDTVKLAGLTREISPELKSEAGGLKISLDKLVLGVSQSVVEFTVAVEPDSDVTGVGFGAGQPFSLGLGPDGQAHAAAAGFTGPPRGATGAPPDQPSGGPGRPAAKDAPPVGIPLLIDLTNGKSAAYEGAKYSTITSTGSVAGSFLFNALDVDAKKLKLSFPPLYAYRQTIPEEKVSLTIPTEGEVLLDRNITAGGKEIYLDRLSVEGERLCLYYRLPGQQGYFPVYLPDFRLEDNEGRPLGHSRNTWENETGRIEIYLTDPGQRDLTLNLAAVGEKLPDVVFDRIPVGN
ncbi:zf-HC2 domain-containing protein [Pelotomaculum propionicicum]|uniref:Anti-sigma-W factor RsiW n=1 Tax=Pelotomaculum propionicicum TaxID=258475 RepID=A0A4Y7RPK2_9FIRM|nr:zf-HC2 domain-containing protein [Pelotomaculum propionicicum]TEB10771.1 hypothetical protein Pmgp_02086 [Pelotomaculum propionicicum]